MLAAVTIAMFPEPGHLLPTLRIASRLIALGHRVTYAVPDRYAAQLRGLGFDCHVAFDDGRGGLRTGSDVPVLYDGRDTGLSLWRRLAPASPDRQVSVRSVVRTLAPSLLLPALRATAPDVVLCDSKIVAACADMIREAHAGRIIAIRTELPVGDIVNCPELILCPSQLERPDAISAAPGRHYCEPSVFETVPRNPRQTLRSSRPDDRLVLCSLGTQSAEYRGGAQAIRNAIDAFAGRGGYRLVVAAGVWKSHHLLRVAPTNVEIHTSVPQLDIMRVASLAILHGGLGGIKEAILCGVPMILLPFAFDQYDNASRVAFHGLGEICTPCVSSPDDIWHAAQRQLSGNGQVSRASMQNVFYQAEVAAPAVALIARTIHGSA